MIYGRKVLLLNASYEPLSLVTAPKALALVWRRVAETLEIDKGVRIRSPSLAHCLARLLIGGRRHGAGVDQDELGTRGRVAVDDPDPALAEQPRGRLHLGLVDLAAEVRDRRRPDGARRRSERLGHHSCGFVLIRKPIVPTSAAIA